MAAFAVIACEPEIVPEVNVTSTETTLPVAGTEDLSFKVTFNANVDWTAALKTPVEWCAVTPATGVAGDASVTVIAEANETKENRTVVLVITAGTAVKEVELTQLQKDAFELVAAEGTIGAEGGNFDLKVKTNVPYTVTVEKDVDWVSVAASKAYEETTTTLSVKPYEELDATRTAKITVSAAGLEDLTFTLTQEGPVTKIWGIDLTTVLDRVGSYTNYVDEVIPSNVSIAVWDGKVVVCAGNGKPAVLLDKTTGEKVGELNTGDIVPGYVTNDDAGNLVFCTRTWNYWVSYHMFTVYYMKPGDTEPTYLVDTYKQDGAYVASYVGARLAVRGDVTKNAAIAAPWEGVAGYGDNMVLAWNVVNGEPEMYVKQTLTGFEGLVSWYGAPGYWSGSPSNFPGYALLGPSLSAGAVMALYDENDLYIVDGETYVCTEVVEDIVDSNNAANAFDVRDINGKTYLAVAGGCFFPQWGLTPVLKIVDASTMTYVVEQANTKNYALTGETDADGNPLYLEGVGASAAVVMEATEDGMNVYHINNNCSAIEAFHFAL